MIGVYIQIYAKHSLFHYLQYAAYGLLCNWVIKMKIIQDVQYGEYKETLLDIYLPDSDEFSVFVFFHGGGYVNGNKDYSKHGVFPARFITHLVDRGIAVVSCDYRMYPDAKFPEYIQDGAKAIKWVHDNMSSYGKVNKIFAGGSSAGAHTTMQLCFNKKYFEEVGLDSSAVDGYFHDAGQPTVHFNVLKEYGIDSRREIVDERAPLYYIGMADNYPPMKFVASDNDMKCRLIQTKLVIEALKHFDYDMSKVHFSLMHGTHTSYLPKADADGESVYGKLIYDFMKMYI